MSYLELPKGCPEGFKFTYVDAVGRSIEYVFFGWHRVIHKTPLFEPTDPDEQDIYQTPRWTAALEDACSRAYLNLPKQ